VIDCADKGAGYAGTGYRGYAYYGAPVGYADYGGYGPFGMVNGLFGGLFGWWGADRRSPAT
jgi:hypothetical protein